MSSSTQPTNASILTIGHVGSLTAFRSAVAQFKTRWESVKSGCRSLERYRAGMMETRRYDPATQQSHSVPLETLIGEMDNFIAGHLEPILSYRTSEDARRPIDFDALRALTDRMCALATASRLLLPIFCEPGSILFATGMIMSYRLRSRPPTRARPLQRRVWCELDVINADAAAMCAMLRTVHQAQEDLQAASEKDTASGGVTTSASAAILIGAATSDVSARLDSLRLLQAVLTGEELAKRICATRLSGVEYGRGRIRTVNEA